MDATTTIQIIGIVVGVGVPVVFGTVRWALTSIHQRLDKLDKRWDKIVEIIHDHDTRLTILERDSKTT